MDYTQVAPQKKKSGALAPILFILALVIIGAIGYIIYKAKKNKPTPTPNPNPNPNPNPGTLPACPSGYNCSQVGDKCIDKSQTVWYCEAGSRSFQGGATCPGPCWNTTAPVNVSLTNAATSVNAPSAVNATIPLPSSSELVQHTQIASLIADDQ